MNGSISPSNSASSTTATPKRSSPKTRYSQAPFYTAGQVPPKESERSPPSPDSRNMGCYARSVAQDDTPPTYAASTTGSRKTCFTFHLSRWEKIVRFPTSLSPRHRHPLRRRGETSLERTPVALFRRKTLYCALCTLCGRACPTPPTHPASAGRHATLRRPWGCPPPRARRAVHRWPATIVSRAAAPSSTQSSSPRGRACSRRPLRVRRRNSSTVRRLVPAD